MDTASLKRYAPEARRSFMDAVRAQAARYGITAKGVEEATVQGDVLLVGGQAYPKTVAEPRRRLVERIEEQGFEPTMETVAYTWFNRLAAIRYMELHGYLDHGYRVLSHPDGQSRPEILDHATDIDLPGLDRARIVELKLDGTKDEELYRLLVKAQCNALHQAMPFLFEKLGDETELLLPANLLHSDSLVRQLVEGIDEDAWQQIEIIGWLYQFYISEKKDQVIGKVVKSEDIPAATQLFTPNWIVKYMVQNSLGAQWLATYPQSPLKGQMEYYIEPAEQTDEVNAQLAAITPSQLDPEELTLIDPACGSGHILVEAYELFKAIYLERGYRQRDVPQLILEKNLYGLDIDERAAQLSGFALVMKARADDRRLFERGVTLNVMALVDSVGFDAEGLAKGVGLADYGLKPGDLTELKRLFEHATTFGSLIQVPEGVAEKLPALKKLSEMGSHDLFVSDTLKRLGPLVQQAGMLATQYDAVVANPPYMGSGAMPPALKSYVRNTYANANKDLFACFIEIGLTLSHKAARCSMITMHSWMFLRSYEALRTRLVSGGRLRSLLHLGSGAFTSISGEVVQTAAFVLNGHSDARLRPVFHRLVEGGETQKAEGMLEGCGRFDALGHDRFSLIPGSPVAYWLPPNAIDVLGQAVNLGEIAEPRKGMCTRDNDYFVRYWAEVSVERLCFTAGSREEALTSGRRWFPYQKGGATRTWFGNHEAVVDWERDGYRLLNMESLGWSGGSTNHNLEFIFKPALVWKKISGTRLSCRFSPAGFLYDDASGVCGFDDPSVLLRTLAYLNSKVGSYYMGVINPTLNIQPGNMAAMPVIAPPREPNARLMIRVAENDWAVAETAWDFQSFPLLTPSSGLSYTLESSYTAWINQNRATIAEMQRLEEENNRLFIDAYGLQDELTPDVPIEEITLTVNPAYRYGGKLTEEEQWTRFREDTMQELVSYAVGCMMGRYSLDEPGLIYAHSGNEGFDPSRYPTFPADADAIVPLTDTEWFADDATNRVVEFISVAWDRSHLEENLTFLASNLSPKKGESSRDTIRRYLCDSFFKDHLKTYKKRPIYWLFSSGKQKAFQCLVYLHRYNEGTLARMRSEYVIPLEGKIAARIEQLGADIQAATSSAHRKRLEKEQDKLQKQQVELLTFDEKLRHYADRRINLDLDDGVKVNYGKFGDLLAEVKAVHGKKAGS